MERLPSNGHLPCSLDASARKEQFRITRGHVTNHSASRHILPIALDLGRRQGGYRRVQETKNLFRVGTDPLGVCLTPLVTWQPLHWEQDCFHVPRRQQIHLVRVVLPDIVPVTGL